MMSTRRCPKEVKQFKAKCATPFSIGLPHEQLHGGLKLSRAKQGRITVPHSLHGRTFEQKVPLIMYSMQGALQAQAPVLWDTRTPAQDRWPSPSENVAACACGAPSKAASKER